MNHIASPLRVLNSGSDSSEVLYISECSSWGARGFEVVSAEFRSVRPVFWSPGMPKPDLSGWRGDWIISFKSDLVLPRATLKLAKKGAINFHPSPPKYRGVGGYWWALQNGDKSFGVTCHHMDDRIDHGAIIKTESFPIKTGETVERLKERAAVYSLGLLNETLGTIQSGKPLTPCGTEWQPHLYTYKELALAQNKGEVNGYRIATKAMPALKASESVAKDAIDAAQIETINSLFNKDFKAGVSHCRSTAVKSRYH